MAAAIAGASQPALRIPSFLPRLSAPTVLRSSRTWSLYSRQLTSSLFPTLSFAVPAVTLNIPAWLGDIWEGILRAVPKKKTTHSKKRHRQMAGKALRDVQSICKCPGCGQPKRTHVLCPHCANEIKGMWQQANPSGKYV